MPTTCLHDHDGDCGPAVCNHQECNRMESYSKDELKRVREEILAVLAKFNDSSMKSWVELCIDVYGDRDIELRYWNNGKWTNSIKLEE